MSKVAIITDTNSGIMPAEGEALGIKVLPTPFMIDGVEYSVLCRVGDGLEFVPNDVASGGGDINYVFIIKYVK